jgi:hypothetical protein
MRLKEMETNGEPFNILNAYKAFTSDVITTYAFGQNNQNLDIPDFNAGFWQLFHVLAAKGATINQFEWVLSIIRSLPDWLQKLMGMDHLMTWEKVWLVLLSYRSFSPN